MSHVSLPCAGVFFFASNWGSLAVFWLPFQQTLFVLPLLSLAPAAGNARVLRITDYWGSCCRYAGVDSLFLIAQLSSGHSRH